MTDPASEGSPTSAGRRLVTAIASRDRPALEALLDPAVDFRALTPGRFWEAATPADVADVVLGHWFEAHDRVVRVAQVDEGLVADTHRVGYRFELECPGGPHLVEQQAYYRTGGDRIVHLRVACSGFRPR